MALAILAVASLSALVLGWESAVADKIRKSGKVTIGYRESSIPFSQINNAGKPEGYSIDLCLAIVDFIKTDWSLPNLQIDYVPVTSQTRIPLIANGTIDLECGSTTNTLARGKQVDFLVTTFVTGSKIAVRANSDINEIEDLRGKRGVVAAGSTNERIAHALNREKGLNMTIISATDQAQGWLTMETGRADAFVSDDVILFGFRAKARNPNDFKVAGRLLSFDPYGIMLRRNDSTFRLAGNQALARIFKNGEAEKIHKKWFEPIGVPPNPLLKASFELHALPD